MLAGRDKIFLVPSSAIVLRALSISGFILTYIHRVSILGTSKGKNVEKTLNSTLGMSGGEIKHLCPEHDY